ncbi:hypothetical protein V6N13_109761 [Hibiscus sabdariffa]
MHDSTQICHGRKSPARSVGGKFPACGVGGKSPTWAGESVLAGNMPDSAQLCRGRFTNSAPADVIVAAFAGSECYQPGTASVQLPIWQRSGQISIEALTPRARLWELVLNDLNDGFVKVPGVCHEGQPPSLTSVNPPCKICLWW